MKRKKRKMDQEKREIDLLGRGITLGIIGGLASNFFVTYFLSSSKIVIAKLPEKMVTVVNSPFFGLIISAIFLISIFRIFKCRIKNFENDYKLSNEELDKSLDACVFPFLKFFMKKIKIKKHLK